jgi:hypothetical protein
MLLHEPEVFRLEARAEIPPPGSHETALPLVYPLNKVIVDLGGGAIHPCYLVHGIRIRLAKLVMITHFRCKQLHPSSSMSFLIN